MSIMGKHISLWITVWASVIITGFFHNCQAQTLVDCRILFIEAMPESLDRFVSAELLKWGAIRVVVDEKKADCIVSFGRPSSTVKVKSSGSIVVPSEVDVKAERADSALPSGGDDGSRSGAIDIIHKESSTVVWAHSSTDSGFFQGGPPKLAKKLVGQLRKDYQKLKKP